MDGSTALRLGFGDTLLLSRAIVLPWPVLSYALSPISKDNEIAYYEYGLASFRKKKLSPQA